MIQNISIEVSKSATEKEEYRFLLFDTTLVFDMYKKQSKTPKQKLWRNVEIWSRLGGRDSTIPQPEIPGNVSYQALEHIKSMLKVQTWEQYKARK